MRVVERDGLRRVGQIASQIEGRVIWQKRAGDDARRRLPLAVDDHAAAGAHLPVWRSVEYIPARLGNFRHIGASIHFREQHHLQRVCRIDVDATGRKQRGIGGSLRSLRLPRHAAPRGGDGKAIGR